MKQIVTSSRPLPVSLTSTGCPSDGPWNDERGGQIANYLLLLWRAKTVVLCAGLAGLALGVAARLAVKPTYQARTVLEVRALNERFLNRENLDPRAMNSVVGTESYLQTQFHILNGDQVMRRALRKLSPGQGDEAISQSAVESAHKLVKSKVIPQTRLIEITSQSRDPQQAADLANALASEFINQDAESQRAAMNETNRLLEETVARAKADLQQSEASLRRLLRGSGVLLNSRNENVKDDQFQQVQTELVAAQADRIAKQAFHEQVKVSSPESLPDVLNDATLRDYRSQLATLRRELADQATVLAPRHYKLQKLRSQIDQLEGERLAYQKRVVEKIGNEYESAGRRERLLSARALKVGRDVAAESEKVLEYRRLRGQFETHRQVYESALQQSREAATIAATGATNIRVVDPAAPPVKPSTPSLPVAGLVGLGSGLLLGAVFAFGREWSTDVLREPSQVVASLHVPRLSVVPGRSLTLPDSGRIEAATLLPGDVESYSALLSAMAQDGPSKAQCFVIASPGEGEGKTLTTALLGIAAAHAGRRVLLVSGDLVFPKLHELFGTPNVEGLADLMVEQDLHRLASLIVPTGIENLHLLPSGPPAGDTISLFNTPFLAELVASWRHRFDLILIDSPPLLQLADARLLAAHADGVVLSLRAGRTTREVSMVARDRLAQYGLPLTGVVLNEADSANSAGRYASRLLKRWENEHAA